MFNETVYSCWIVSIRHSTDRARACLTLTVQSGNTSDNWRTKNERKIWLVNKFSQCIGVWMNIDWSTDNISTSQMVSKINQLMKIDVKISNKANLSQIEQFLHARNRKESEWRPFSTWKWRKRMKYIDDATYRNAEKVLRHLSASPSSFCLSACLHVNMKRKKK